MSRPRALDLFCGAGGAAMGLHRAGFDVVGIDNRKQPRYPFPFIQADALRPPVRLEDFDLVWASPPCQGYSRMRHLPWCRDKKHPMLIDAVRELLGGHSASCIENVGDSPLKGFTLTGPSFGMLIRRLRRFETSFFVMVPQNQEASVVHAGRMLGERLRSQEKHVGCEWMTAVERLQAVPPSYSEHIGRYAMMALGLDPAPPVVEPTKEEM